MTLVIYIGYDPRDDLASKVCRDSLLAHSTIPLDIRFLKLREARAQGFRRAYFVDEDGQMYDAGDRKPFSTEFSFTRFLVPHLMQYDKPAIFVDADFLFRADIGYIWSIAEDTHAAWCVQQDHKPKEYSKMDGVLQTIYDRKNWSSFMFLHTHKCRTLTPYQVNTAPGWWLHGLRWVDDRDIGELPLSWNWLPGYSDESIAPAAVHFTQGTPDMPQRPATKYDDEWWGYARKYKDQEAA